MTTQTMIARRGSVRLAAACAAVLASCAGTANAVEYEFDNGVRLNWNTTLSVGSSWRAEEASRELYTKAGGSLIGLTSGPTLPPVPPNALIDPNDVGMLEDTLVAAVNEAILASQEHSAKRMEEVTGGVEIPGLM